MTSRVAALDEAYTAGLEPIENAFMVPIERIRRWHRQPRSWFAPEPLDELTEDIRRNGILQPLIVRPDRRSDKPPGGFLLTIGERRWRAARAAGLTMVPVLVRDAPTKQALLDSLRENIQRQDLTPGEELEGLRGLVELGMDAKEIALELSLSYANVTRRLRVLEDEVLGQAVANGALSLADAFELLVLVPDEQRDVLATFQARKQAGLPVTRDALRDLVQDRRRRRQADALPAPASPRPASPPSAGAAGQSQGTTAGTSFIPAGGLAVDVPVRLATNTLPRPAYGFPGTAPGPSQPADAYGSGAARATASAGAPVQPGDGRTSAESPSVPRDQAVFPPTANGSADVAPIAPISAETTLSSADLRAQRRAYLRAADLRAHIEQQLSVIAASYPRYAELPDVMAELEAAARQLEEAIGDR